jgi:hypothetical protein
MAEAAWLVVGNLSIDHAAREAATAAEACLKGTSDGLPPGFVSPSTQNVGRPAIDSK